MNGYAYEAYDESDLEAAFEDLEYDEARRIARERSIPLQTVLRKLAEVARGASGGA